MTLDIEPFYAMDILARARELEAEGRRICHLEVGEPSAPPAPEVRTRVAQSLELPQRYSESKGMLALRDRLAAHYAAEAEINLAPENIVLTTGSSGGFLLAFLGLLPAGARIAVTRPGYPAYLNIILALGFVPVEIELSPQSGWRLDAATMARAHQDQPFDALLLASPANPTGAIVGALELERIMAACRDLGVLFLSDEIYHGLCFAQEAVSARRFDPEAVVINSFSKRFCMTGWRIGWLLPPADKVRHIEMLAQSMFISPPAPAQTAGLAALDRLDYAEAERRHYAGNRDILCAGLEEIGFGLAGRPDGAFYAYADISRFSRDSMQFCRELLDKAGVAATPGRDFDRVRGNDYVRFSFAGSEETLRDALARLKDYLA